MPTGYFVRKDAEKIEALTQRLRDEWSPVGPPHDLFGDRPVIRSEKLPAKFDAMRSPLHLYVIWNEWADLPQQTRSEIIMDAYEATQETPNIVRVTLAMGLTQDEAQKMGLQYKINR